MKSILLLVTVAFLLCASTSAQQANAGGNNFTDSVDQRMQPVKKNVVRLYPNPSYGKLSVTALTSKPLHFYIFDMEGTLVYQAVLNNKDRKSIDNLKKGTYLYDVFETDVSIEEGKIIVK
jgi:hypothetical protein